VALFRRPVDKTPVLPDGPSWHDVIVGKAQTGDGPACTLAEGWDRLQPSLYRGVGPAGETMPERPAGVFLF
jgi:hypothetical protein